MCAKFELQSRQEICFGRWQYLNADFFDGMVGVAGVAGAGHLNSCAQGRSSWLDRGKILLNSIIDQNQRNGAVCFANIVG